MSEDAPRRSRALIWLFIFLLMFSNFAKTCRIDRLTERVKKLEIRLGEAPQ
jgi:hypothetical protein